MVVPQYNKKYKNVAGSSKIFIENTIILSLFNIIMDPNKKEELPAYEKNAKIMYWVGFGLCPLSWLMAWIYCSRRKSESQYLADLGKKCFILFWIAVYIFGIWTMINDAFWPKMLPIQFNVPIGEPE